MRFVSAAEVDAALTFTGLIDTLRDAFVKGAVQPVRHHHTVERPGASDTTLLLMPAWSDFTQSGDGFLGVKIVTVSPDNNSLGKPAVMGVYLLLDGATGEPLALIDGQRLTLWRTASASALAADYLARPDARQLTVIGAGALSSFLAQAHAAIRPIDHVTLWNRTPENAEKVAAGLRAKGLEASVATDLDAALSGADIVSCATLSSVPLVRGAALKAGTHVDLVGAFSPTMRESDDAAIAKARVYVDTIGGATKEAGDIVQAMASGALTREGVVGDLYDLTRGKVSGRGSADEITLFKSVGAAIEDLAAGIAVYRRVTGSARR